MVEVRGDGRGRRGGQLHGGEGVPVHHPDQYTGNYRELGLELGLESMISGHSSFVKAYSDLYLLLQSYKIMLFTLMHF